MRRAAVLVFAPFGFALVVFAQLDCGGSSSSSSPTAAFAAQLVGHWQSVGCEIIGFNSQTRDVVLGATTYSITWNYSGTGGCDFPTGTATESGTYRVVGPFADGGPGTFEVDYTLTKKTYTELFNEVPGNCGALPWTVGETQDVTAACATQTWCGGYCSPLHQFNLIDDAGLHFAIADQYPQLTPALERVP